MRGNCNAISDYKKIRRIGEGTYGHVYLARHRETNKTVALKRIILHHEEQEGFPFTSIREINLLRRLTHPNIILLQDIVVGLKRDGVFLVFDYIPYDLAAIVKGLKYSFQESEIKCLLLQLLSGVEFIHKHWILHRDIKLSNILYHPTTGELKLCDFGMSRTVSHHLDNDLTPLVVTLWYRSPEILLGAREYSFPADVWSVGCVFAELLLSEPLFGGLSEAEQIQCIFAVLGAPTAAIWPDLVSLPLLRNGSLSLDLERRKYPYNSLSEKFPFLRDAGVELLNSLFTYNPAIRITARQALKSDYFRQSPHPRPQELMPTFPLPSEDKE